MSLARRSRRFAFVTLATTLAVLAFMMLSASVAPAPQLRAASPGPVSATVLFDGVNVASHDSLGSAIATSFSGTFTTQFIWSSPLSSPSTVTQGEVQILFFGAAVGTSTQQQLQSGSGNFTLKSDFSQNQYIYEGVYEIVATLSDNGTTLLTQDFFIWVQATDHLTIANIVLILVILLEIYQIAALGRAKIPKTPASTPPTTGSSGTPPSTSPPSGAPPPGTPPSGGP